MDKKELNKQLINEFNENIDKINSLEHKRWILERNTIPLNFALLMLILIFSNFVVFLLPLAPELMVCIASFIGCSSSLLITSHFNKELKKFSTAKSQRDILEEETKYAIDIERLKSYNEIIEHIINTLKVERFQTNPIYKGKNSNKTSKLQENLNYEIRKIDALTAKCYLQKRFFPNKKYDITKYPLLYAVFGFLVGMALEIFILKSSIVEFGSFICPIICGVSSAGYGIKQSIDEINVSKSFSESLESDCLEETVDFNNSKSYDNELKDAIRVATDIRKRLEIVKLSLSQTNQNTSVYNFEDNKMNDYKQNAIINEELQNENYQKPQSLKYSMKPEK